MAKVPPPPDLLPVTNPGALQRMTQRFQRVVAWSTRRVTTSATAGSASALPGVPAGYVDIEIVDATTGVPARKKIPYWNP